ncbi:acyl-CoA thioesterase [Zoogloea sp.]|uniref:acyl-CoA thioesterase n=1 Tax=Zoogloea sp. TaxID=49181 RepID=UPI00262792C7|nr:acyl-CoA thioesterase [Zoogloea sp.]MDD3354071.1 acyl-CoA thioesterase [Zoogloea sp.]
MNESASLQPRRKRVHTSRQAVRWGDMDFYGHVNNTVYFRFCEQARVEWIEKEGFIVSPQSETGAVIINAACTFLLPINYPATVIVNLYAGEPGRSSVMTWYEIFVEGDERLYAEGSSKIVWMDPQTGKSAPIPECLRLTLS